MARIRTIAELDDAIASAQVARSVPILPLETGGVDPLGLRQLNFDLMDGCIPGLNNAAWRIRPYVVMSWSWWQAARLAKRDGLDVLTVAVGRRFVDRIEVLFQIGQLRAGDFDSLPGVEDLQARVVNAGGYDFSTPDWETWHVKRRGQGSLMAPVSYGPSAKEGLGLGFLRSSEGLFAPVDEVMPAVLALDARLAPALSHEAFSSLECGWVPLDCMEAWHPLWRMRDIADEEVAVGGAALLGVNAVTPRGRMVRLVGLILASAAGPLDVATIRREGARSDRSWSVEGTARLWRAMQARQLLRLSLEGLLSWVLVIASEEPVSLDKLVSALCGELDVPSETKLDEWLALDCPTRDGLGGVVSPVSLLDDIDGVRQWEEPALCLAGLRASTAVCRAMGDDPDLFGGQPDRLPLATLSRRLRSGGGLSMREACELIVSELLIGQHAYWAVGRSGDDTQRLRIVLDEGGRVALRSGGRSNPTPDRLYTLLELASDCHIVERIGDGYVTGPLMPTLDVATG
nr:hypothetical protein [uncultured Sphingomonas sp.]